MKFTDLKLSISQEFVTLALIGENMFKKKKFKMGNNKIYSITSIFMELFLIEKISLNEKQQIIVINHDLTEVQYVDIILKTIDSKKPMKLKKWIEYFYTNYKLCNSVYNTVIESLVNKNVLEVQSKDSLLGAPKKQYKDIHNIGNCIIQKIRAELLEEGEVDENTIYLALILDGNKMLGSYFSEYEYKAIKYKMEQLYGSDVSEKYKIIKKVINEIEVDSLFALLLGLV